MTDLDSQRVTQLLAEAGMSDASARELLPIVYDELRRLAATHFATERDNHTLQPTALVNEAFLRIVAGRPIRVTSRSHFFRLASTIMRRVLVDHARAKDALRRGGDIERYTLTMEPGQDSHSTIDLLALEEALDRLSALSPQKARLVELRFFGGLTIEETADALEISRTQATREWRMARAWLADELGEGA